CDTGGRWQWYQSVGWSRQRRWDVYHHSVPVWQRTLYHRRYCHTSRTADPNQRRTSAGASIGQQWESHKLVYGLLPTQRDYYTARFSELRGVLRLSWDWLGHVQLQDHRLRLWSLSCSF